MFKNSHLVFSFIKSTLRIAGCYFLFAGNFVVTAILFFASEVFGIIEEL